MSALTMELRNTQVSRWFEPPRPHAAADTPNEHAPTRTLRSRRRFYAALEKYLATVAEYYGGDIIRLARDRPGLRGVAEAAGQNSASSLDHVFGSRSATLAAFLREKAPHLLAPAEPAGSLERLVLQAKAASFWPYREGWLSMLESLGEPPRRVAAESLVRVVAEWAAQQPLVAATCDFAPPVAALEDLTVAAGITCPAGAREGRAATAETVGALAEILRRAVRRSLDDAGATSGGVLESIRADLHETAFPEVGAARVPRQLESLMTGVTHLLLRMSPGERRAVAAELRRLWETANSLLPTDVPAETGQRGAGVGTGGPGDQVPDTGGGDVRAGWRGVREPPRPAGAAPGGAEADASTAAALETLMHHVGEGGSPADAERILEIQLGNVPADSAIAFRIQAWLEELRSRRRPAAESAAAWHRLRERAERLLGADDRVVLNLGALATRYATISGDPRALDAAVRSWEELAGRRARLHGPDAHLTRMSRVNHAKAIRERDGPGDLALARRLLSAERDAAVADLGADHPFTLTVQAILAYTMIRSIEERPGEASAGLATDVEVIARSVATKRTRRFGTAAAPTLRALLLHAHALLLAGRSVEAADNVRLVIELAPGVHPSLPAGWAELLLARALADTDRGTALDAARASFRLREKYYPPDSREVLEAARLAEELDDDPYGRPEPPGRVPGRPGTPAPAGTDP